MMDLSPFAAEALNSIRDEQGLPSDSTVRISAMDGSRELRISFVDSPAEGDEVAEAHGLPYAVAPEVADLLGNALLDVQQEDDERGFVLRSA